MSSVVDNNSIALLSGSWSILSNDDCPITDAAPPSAAHNPEDNPNDSTDHPSGYSTSIYRMEIVAGVIAFTIVKEAIIRAIAVLLVIIKIHLTAFSSVIAAIAVILAIVTV